MSTGDDEQQSSNAALEGADAEAGSVSNRALAMFLAALVVALVLGYALLNKLADISQEEDCALARRTNCGATEIPSGR